MCSFWSPVWGKDCLILQEILQAIPLNVFCPLVVDASHHKYLVSFDSLLRKVEKTRNYIDICDNTRRLKIFVFILWISFSKDITKYIYISFLLLIGDLVFPIGQWQRNCPSRLQYLHGVFTAWLAVKSHDSGRAEENPFGENFGIEF